MISSASLVGRRIKTHNRGSAGGVDSSSSFAARGRFCQPARPMPIKPSAASAIAAFEYIHAARTACRIEAKVGSSELIDLRLVASP